MTNLNIYYYIYIMANSYINELKDNNFFISSWKHINPIPEHLKTITSEEFELVLRLASESLLSLRESTNSHKFQDVLNKKILEENQRIQTKHEQDVLILQNKYNKEITKKQKDLDKLELSKNQIQESYNLLQQNFLNLQNYMTQAIEKNISCNMEKQNIFLSGQITSIQNLVSSRETMYKEQITDLKRSLEQYQKQSLIEQNSSNKGKQGETSFDAMVAQLTSWNLEDTSKIPDAGDRQSNIRGCKTLFELKNYSNKVPKSEVDKFKRNMEQHKDAPLGVFISLKTQIVGGSQDMLYTEINSNNQLLVYIQNFLSLDTDTIFSVLNNYIDMALLLYTKVQEAEDTIDIQSKIDSIKPILNSSFVQISQMMNEINNNKKFMIDKITQQHSSLRLHIDKMKLLFESILKAFFPEDSTNMIIEDSQSDTEKKKSQKRQKKSLISLG